MKALLSKFKEKNSETKLEKLERKITDSFNIFVQNDFNFSLEFIENSLKRIKIYLNQYLKLNEVKEKEIFEKILTSVRCYKKGNFAEARDAVKEVDFDKIENKQLLSYIYYFLMKNSYNLLDYKAVFSYLDRAISSNNENIFAIGFKLRVSFEVAHDVMQSLNLAKEADIEEYCTQTRVIFYIYFQRGYLKINDNANYSAIEKKIDECRQELNNLDAINMSNANSARMVTRLSAYNNIVKFSLLNNENKVLQIIDNNKKDLNILLLKVNYLVKKNNSIKAETVIKQIKEKLKGEDNNTDICLYRLFLWEYKLLLLQDKYDQAMELKKSIISKFSLPNHSDLLIAEMKYFANQKQDFDKALKLIPILITQDRYNILCYVEVKAILAKNNDKFKDQIKFIEDTMEVLWENNQEKIIDYFKQNAELFGRYFNQKYFITPDFRNLARVGKFKMVEGNKFKGLGREGILNALPLELIEYIFSLLASDIDQTHIMPLILAIQNCNTKEYLEKNNILWQQKISEEVVKQNGIAQYHQ